MRHWMMVVAVGLLGCVVACGDDDDGVSAEAASLVIGPEGGSVELPSGGKIEIPVGALTESVSIKVTKLELHDVAPLPSNLQPAGKPYAFEPHGLVFQAPVKIELPFDADATEVRPVKLPSPGVGSSQWTTVFPSEKDDTTRKLSLETTSFSVYLAASPRRDSGVVTLPDGAVMTEDGGVADGSAGSGGAGGVGGGSGVGGDAGGAGSEPVQWLNCEASDLTGATPVGSETSGDIHWSGRVLVERTMYFSNARLTIDPGTVVVMGVDASLELGWSGAGSIFANGTPEQPIKFCGQFADPGYWGELRISNAVTSDAVLRNVLIADATSVTLNAPITVNQVQVRNTAAGLTASDFRAGSAGLSVDGSGASPVTLTGAGAITRFPRGGQLMGNADDRVHLDFGTLSADTTFHDLGVPYSQRRTLYVSSSAVTFEAGVVYEAENDTTLHVGWSGSCRIQTNGTAAAPVVFRGFIDEPGAWRGIDISSSVLSMSRLTYTEIHHGGGGGTPPLSLNAPIRLDHVRLVDNAIGMDVAATGFGANSTHLSITGTASLSARPLVVRPDALISIPQGGSFTGNGVDQIEVVGGTFQGIGTIANLGVPYFVRDTIYISDSSTEVTIAPGIEFRMNAGVILQVGWSGAPRFTAVGTPTAPIRFVGLVPNLGYWEGINVFDAVRTDSALSYVEVGHAGAGTNQRAAINMDAVVPVTHSRFFDSTGPGIGKRAANPTDYTITNSFENTSGTVVDR